MSQDDIATVREGLEDLDVPYAQAFNRLVARLHAAEEEQKFVLDELDVCRKAYRSLEARLHAAEEERDRLQALLVENGGNVLRVSEEVVLPALQKVEALEAELDRLREALTKVAWHSEHGTDAECVEFMTKVARAALTQEETP